MADVQLTATRIDAMMLPSNFSRAYQLYVLNQSSDMQLLASQTNTASSTAEAAQQHNNEQDEQIAAQGATLEQISGDYVSKAATDAQAVAGAFGAASFTINGVQVIGARVTGFTAATGSAYRGGFSADQSYDAATAPDGLKEARQRIKALEDALRAHGLID
ncbi:DNA stabilization protein [Erwinia sp. OPT-41]|uniref:DNA stabilization protein n=1 Tax=Erwinia plantamica TaxID=3237104 RepID=A0ABW7CPB0_9GAMM